VQWLKHGDHEHEKKLGQGRPTPWHCKMVLTPNKHSPGSNTCYCAKSDRSTAVSPQVESLNGNFSSWVIPLLRRVCGPEFNNFVVGLVQTHPENLNQVHLQLFWLVLCTHGSKQTNRQTQTITSSWDFVHVEHVRTNTWYFTWEIRKKYHGFGWLGSALYVWFDCGIA